MKLGVKCVGVCADESVAAVGSFCGWEVQERNVLTEKDEGSGRWQAELDVGNGGTELKFVVVGRRDLRVRRWECHHGNRWTGGGDEELSAWFPSVVFKVRMAENVQNEGKMMIVGAPPQLGEWKHPVPMRQLQDGSWTVVLPPIQWGWFSYRYVFHSHSDGCVWWERDPDRCTHGTDPNGAVERDDGTFRDNIEFHTIWDRLIMGPYPQRLEDVKTLRKAGVTAVFSLQADEELLVRNVHLPTICNLYRQSNMTLYRLPIVDFNQDALRAGLLRAAGALRTLLDEAEFTGGYVYIHCMSGISRSAAVAAVERCDRTGRCYGEVMDEMRRRRPIVSPNHEVTASLVGQQLPQVRPAEILDPAGQQVDHGVACNDCGPQTTVKYEKQAITMPVSTDTLRV
mmetsp:Transcript_101/g.292  ORF Transcript_101/g.292 Transcript_101/m.292 type:complete len:398 (+) Transcript_101:106-1299(+)